MRRDERILLLGDMCYKEVFNKVVIDLKAKFENKNTYHLEYTIRIFDYLDNSVHQEILKNTEYTLVCICIAQSLTKISVENALSNIEKLIEIYSGKGIKVILGTIPLKGNWKKYKSYNKRIMELATKKNLFVADFNTFFSYYKKDLPDISGNVINAAGISIMCSLLKSMIMHSKLLVLWQYNGRYAHCNYACPYCYVATSVNKGMHFQFDISTWEKAFERHFGSKETIFYFSYGEPLMGGNLFYEILEMIGQHPNWEVRMTSNVSVNLERLLNTTLARTKRLNINASFHPTQTHVENFIEKCNEIRRAGIEPSIVYVMYPEQIDDFENKYLPVFNSLGYRVHIRAFRGLYKGKKYPQAYNNAQWEKTAKYMDMGNFRYQLNAINGLGRVSFLGVSHILVDNYGKIEMCDSYVGDRHYGNVFDEKINLDIAPQPFPGLVPLAAVDDIADYYEIGYDELTENNINNYIEQGGVYKSKNSIIYPLENVNFKDKHLKKELLKVPSPQVSRWRFWLNPKWFAKHFIYSYVIKKYGKYILAWIRGKLRLMKAGKLRKENFWHG